MKISDSNSMCLKYFQGWVGNEVQDTVAKTRLEVVNPWKGFSIFRPRSEKSSAAISWIFRRNFQGTSDSYSIHSLITYSRCQYKKPYNPWAIFFFFPLVLEFEVGLRLARQVLYHLSHSSALYFLYFSPCTLSLFLSFSSLLEGQQISNISEARLGNMLNNKNWTLNWV
jgi:hypothetical protein